LEGECADVNSLEDKEPGEVVEVTSSSYASPDEEIEIEFTAEVFEDDAAAGQSFVNARRLANDCAEQFADVFLEAVQNEVASETPAPGETPIDLNFTDLTIAEIPFTSFGEDSALLRVTTFFTAEGEQFVIFVDIIAVRVGNVITSFSYQTSGEPPVAAGEEEFAARVEARAREAAASLE